MRTECLLLWLLLCIIIGAIVLCQKSLGAYTKMFAVILIGILFVFGGSIINLNTLPSDVQQKLEQVIAVCGDTYIKVDGNDVYVDIGERWLNLNGIAVIESVLNDKLTIQYEGKEIYLGNSGVVNTLKTLKYFGLIDSE